VKIAKNTVVTVSYTLSDAQNKILEEGLEPITYLHGGYDTILPVIEQALEGQEIGYTTMIQVEPEDAFGEYDAMLVRVEDRDRLPSPLEEGMQLEGIPDGEEGDKGIIFMVTAIAEDKVILDGNHPLAGMALRFSLNVLDVRAATDEEIAREYVLDNLEENMDDEDNSNQYRSFLIH